MLAAGEHQMFEEMRATGLPGAFILCTDPIADRERHVGRRPVLMNDDHQAIAQHRSRAVNVQIVEARQRCHEDEASGESRNC